MIKVAITGNIASGKSEVEKILRSKGYPVLDTDIVSHELLVDNQQVMEEFKKYDIFEDDKISRPKLGKLVFHNKVLLKKLENILHPQIILEINKFCELNKNEDMIFVTVPVLFESGWQWMFDKIILVYAEDRVRYQRLVKRRGYDDEYASTRINAQMSQVEKFLLCDDCIENDGTIPELKVRIAYTLRGLKRVQKR